MIAVGTTESSDSPLASVRRKPIVVFFTPSLNHMIETMAYFLAQDDLCEVRVVTSVLDDEGSEHPWCLQRLRDHGGIEIVSLDRAAQPSDLLLFQLVLKSRPPPVLSRWRALANTSAFLPVTSEFSSIGDRLRELVRSFPHYLGAKFAVFGGRRPLRGRWQFGLQRPIYYSPFIHPQLLVNGDWLAAVTAPVRPQDRRHFRIGFIGNNQPPDRSERLAQCYRALNDASMAIVGLDLKSSYARSAVWITYGAGGESRGLDPPRYMAVLSDMDFCISPPGWGRNWTHRTVEALIRGTIPVIEDPELYDIGLKDNETCFVVRNLDWAEGVRRALAATDSEVGRMRRAVVDLSRRKLTVDQASARLSLSQLFA